MLEYSTTEQLVILVVTLLFPPVTLLILLILVLATFGKSLGIRKTYVKILLNLFEWASVRIETESKKGDDHDTTKIDQSKFSSISPSHDSCNGSLNRSSSSKSLIERDDTVLMRRKICRDDFLARVESSPVLEDGLDFIKQGIEAIIEDEVTLRFSAEELASWNLLTRTSYGYHYLNLRLTVIWCLGFLFRYSILLPFRIVIFIVGLIFLVVSTAFVGYIPEGETKRIFYWNISLMSQRVIARALSVIATFHNSENAHFGSGICVANHTSPIDVMILAQDKCYALVGQQQGGLLGLVQRSLSRASSHIWFERSEVNDRIAVSKKLRDHVDDVTKLPILIFPEGTCINNTSVMMFKKGSFEIGATVYPVAIKYDPRFGDAFWNSSRQTYMQYLIMVMTSWAIVVDVWYLPPMQKLENESAIDFANRVKKVIAAAGGLVELEWDGELKRNPVKKEMLEKQQEEYSKRIKMTETNGYHTES